VSLQENQGVTFGAKLRGKDEGKQIRAGLKPLPLHSLRHRFEKAWLMSGGDAFSLQLVLGHSDTSVTKRYITLWGTDLQKKHMQHSQIDKMIAIRPAVKKRQIEIGL
jgi:integrase